MEQVPGSRLAFVGDGPSRAELEQHFAGMPVVFMVSDSGSVCIVCLCALYSTINDSGLVCLSHLSVPAPVIVD